MSRRGFLVTSTTAMATSAMRSSAFAGEYHGVAPRAAGVDPWLEIDAAVLSNNVREISRLIGGRPILAVVKNNAYGLGLGTVGPILARLDPVWGLAVVRADEAFTLRDAGVRKPILLMGPATDDDLRDVIARDIQIAAFTDDAPVRFARASQQARRPARVHLYVDTGMNRMGYPHARALPWIESIASRKELRIVGAFTELTQDGDFDSEQVARCRALADAARSKGINLGLMHAASSDSVLRKVDANFMDMVRPGIAVYGGSYPESEPIAQGQIRPSYRFKARVIRVDQIAAGEGVNYHRRWIATKPTWTATLAIGHVDGYPPGAAKGCEVLIGGNLYPAVGTVSAGHTIVALGDSQTARVGDEAILVGPDHPAIHPNEVAKRAAWSDYNMFMHLNPGLARVVIKDR
jgi:alanine racemase